MAASCSATVGDRLESGAVGLRVEVDVEHVEETPPLRLPGLVQLLQVVGEEELAARRVGRVVVEEVLVAVPARERRAEDQGAWRRVLMAEAYSIERRTSSS